MSQTYLFTLYVQHITTYKYIIKYFLLLILKKVTKVTSKLHIFLLLLFTPPLLKENFTTV